MKMFKRLGRDIDSKALSDESERKEELKIQLRILQAMSADAKFRLSCWVAPEKVDSLVQIEQMEKSLVKSLEQLQSHKEQLIPQLPEHHALCGRPSEIATL
ncbi:agamous-like MADS-box protein AGL30 isoform X2 [Magnolia sinica]|uniref:agamous-like MADS-box protein AGL30 isoform X2 n=1 Tax=Magnolia sinica TaxID=86752 RepID=UPI0026599182|nr:agamous-like MADS-box protein AGL30 isoform X2 [Magnolia sinica]